MKYFFFLILCFVTALAGNVLAWNDTVTHPHLTRSAVDKSNLDTYLRDNLDLPNDLSTIFGDKRVNILIEEGAEFEDKPACRAGNHFHDPLKPWDQAELTDSLWVVDLWCYFGQYPQNAVVSNVTWGTGFLSAPPQVKDNDVTAFNEWDWDSAREYFHIYLTGKDFSGLDVASDKKTRDEYMAKSFRALGQVLHLLQDTAVPAHVRNDFSQGHTYVFPDDKSMPWKWIGNWMEHLVKDHDKEDWFDQAIGGNLDNVLLTNFWDTDYWDGAVPVVNEAYLGIAEFTNQNFVSEYTIFKNYTFPHESSTNIELYALNLLVPEIVVVEDGKTDEVIYLRKRDHGIAIDHFVIPNYFAEDMFSVTGGVERSYHLDDNCLKDYAAALIPRAIGYSSALLDYFYRGTMDIDNIVVQRDAAGGISGLDFSVKNTSPAGLGAEDMENGFLSLSYQYTVQGQTEPNFVLLQNFYEITTAGNPINSTGNSFSVTFSDPIPGNLSDIQFTLIFRGQLGHEENAVVAKVLPLTTTTRIAFSYQPGGGGEVSDIYTILPDGTDEIKITNATDGRPFIFSPAWSPDGKRLAFDAHAAAPDTI